MNRSLPFAPSRASSSFMGPVSSFRLARALAPVARTVTVGMLAFLASACGKSDAPATPDAASEAPSASVTKLPPSIPPPPAESSLPPPAPAPTAAAAPAPEKDVNLPVRDPAKEPEKTVKAIPGGSVTLYLPDFPGTTWAVTDADKALGKAKEQTIPGFAGPTTPGHEFKWLTTAKGLKAGQTHKVKLVNKKGPKPTGTTFTLTIDLVAS